MSALEQQTRPDLPLDIHEERLAQSLLNMPWEEEPTDLLEASIDLIGNYEEDLLGSASIALMMDSDPVKAHRYVGHHVRKVPFAAASAVAYTQVLHDIVPVLEGGEPLCPNPDVTPYALPQDSATACDKSLTGNAAAFVRCLGGLLEQGWVKAQAAAEDDPKHPYNALWDCYEGGQFFLGCSQHLEGMDCFRDPAVQHSTISQDNALIALELLTHVRLEYGKECAEADQRPSARGATRKALMSADRLGWSSTVNRRVFGPLRHENSLAAEFEELEAAGFGHLQPAFSSDKRLIVPAADNPRIYGVNHKSLAEGPWAYERLCPASMFLAMPAEPDRDILRRFYRVIKAPADEQECPYFSRATLLLQLAALVARATIFKNWRVDQPAISSIDDLIFQNSLGPLLRNCVVARE